MAPATWRDSGECHVACPISKINGVGQA
jgi:hypothetical protein